VFGLLIGVQKRDSCQLATAKSRGRAGPVVCGCAWVRAPLAVTLCRSQRSSDSPGQNESRVKPNKPPLSRYLSSCHLSAALSIHTACQQEKRRNEVTHIFHDQVRQR
jgi:hypothetical protein